MKKIRLAIVGLGRLGHKCAEAIFADQATALAGIVQRTITSPDFHDVPVVTHISELKNVDAALICVPPNSVLGVAKGLLQSRIPTVECARLHGENFLRHKSEIHRIALHHKVPAVVGAGCDPGALSLFRSYFALLVPRGHTETILHAGSSLHHTIGRRGRSGTHYRK
jgi:diaminopimelate dehydrogenase